jgi:hypothetical protein
MAVFEHYRDQIPSAAHAVLVLRAIRSQIMGNDASKHLLSLAGHRPSRPCQKYIYLRFSATMLTTDLPNSELTTTSTTSPTAQLAQDLTGSELCFEDFDLLGYNNMSDAWFGQQLINLDWLELPEV